VSSTRLCSIATGILFIIGSAAGVLALVVMGDSLSGPDYLAEVAQHPDQMAVGAALIAVMELACAGIAYAMYPVLRERNSAIAIATVGLRTAEGIVYLVSAVVLMALVSVATGASAGMLESAATRAAADALKAVYEQASTIGMLPFTVAATLYYALFWQTRLVPRWLSGWGFAGIVVALAVTVFCVIARQSPSDYSFLMMPLAVQEMVLAVYLIAKGFRAVETPNPIGMG
jgi:hypothetical protein